MNPALVVLTVSVISGSAAPARAQGTPRGSSVPARSNTYKLEELTGPQIDALNRERTLFILPVGMLARVPETEPPAVAPTIERTLVNDAAFAAKLEDWLARRRRR
jgi:hypothetical protein